MDQNAINALYLADWQSANLWLLILGFVVAFALAFAVGANDCANSFGTAVGSGVMSFKTACIIGAICETSGAIFLSSNTIKTVTTGVINVEEYQSVYNETTGFWTDPYGVPSGNDTLNPETELLIGEISTIVGSAIWQLIATRLGWPVSATHSTVGGLVGFSLLARGPAGINWMKIVSIVIAWFVSPVSAGLATVALYYPIRKYVVLGDNGTYWGLIAFPILFGFTAFFDCGTILTTGNVFYQLLGIDLDNKGLSELYLWIVSIVFGVFVGGAVLVSSKTTSAVFKSEKVKQVLTVIKEDIEASADGVVNKSFDEKTEEKIGEKTVDAEKSTPVETPAEDDDNYITRTIFKSLQYLSAITGSLAHGGNDVGNSIGCVVMIWLVWDNPQQFAEKDAPYWILAYGGVGISLGLCLFGRRVIETMGTKLTKVTPSRGFCIEIMSAASVLIALKIGVPVSTTHCKVGSIIAVGLMREGLAGVDRSLIIKIVAGWVITIPAAGLVSCAIYAILHAIVLGGAY